MLHTKETLAALLTGREYLKEITKEECLEAKVSGLIVIFGYSDDNVELRGAIHGEVGMYEGGRLNLHRGGVLDDPENIECERCQKRLHQQQKLCVPVDCLWGDGEVYAWQISTSIPHATFEIVEGDEKFCRGVVINALDLPDIENNSK
jgi:hypothetical protein